MREYTITFRSNEDREDLLADLSFLINPTIVKEVEVYAPQNGDVVVFFQSLETLFRSNGEWKHPDGYTGFRDNTIVDYVARGLAHLVVRGGRTVA